MFSKNQVWACRLLLISAINGIFEEETFGKLDEH